MKIFKLDLYSKDLLNLEILDEEGKKCPRCNWKVSTVYTFANSLDEAKENLKKNLALCSECFLDVLIEKYEECEEKLRRIEKLAKDYVADPDLCGSYMDDISDILGVY